MATGSIIVDEFWIIQAIEIIRTILPLQKCYGFENRGRVGINRADISGVLTGLIILVIGFLGLCPRRNAALEKGRYG